MLCVCSTQPVFHRATESSLRAQWRSITTSVVVAQQVKERQNQSSLLEAVQSLVETAKLMSFTVGFVNLQKVISINSQIL